MCHLQNIFEQKILEESVMEYSFKMRKNAANVSFIEELAISDIIYGIINDRAENKICFPGLILRLQI